ncbi:hypothetical protein BamMEX5DRAFT_5309 [Burkholderia ambifaria MEX-5]|uniref:Uncharacterized protein n=1 Tax=Burkholderia ambifaria MEX-5 TaxID=396597 RepID=B1TBZ3_9BURK|nr:hypothetical protein BamMEX5DRAFT_5309 [Burkholderia ambifaria MEX-5]
MLFRRFVLIGVGVQGMSVNEMMVGGRVNLF